MILVIDTNIIVSAIKAPIKKDANGNKLLTKPQWLMYDVLEHKHQMVVSEAIYNEYADVLHRKDLALSSILVEKFLAVIKVYSIWIEPLATKPNEVQMIDEDDRIFWDVAKCLKIKLVTGNFKHYPIDELRTSIDELYD